MVDLHSHTDASDGSDAPFTLVDNALSAGVTALSITDHDTFAGYYAAKPYALSKGLDLLCGIELSTKYLGQTIHLLGYFPGAEPAAAFGEWLLILQTKQRVDLAPMILAVQRHVHEYVVDARSERLSRAGPVVDDLRQGRCVERREVALVARGQLDPQ